MAVGLIKISVHLPESASLKDRRQVIRSVKDRLHHRFNLSIAEMDETSLWQRAELAMVAVGADRGYVDGQLMRAADAALELLRGQDVRLGEIEWLD